MRWGLCAALILVTVSGVLCQNGGYTTSVSGTIGGNSQGACVFPFTYKGVSYTQCTTIDNDNVPWCALTSSFGNGGRWARCQMTVNATRTRQGTGNSGGSNCAFPFLYKGRTYYTCTSVDWGSKKPWCSTSENYDRDRRWGECVVYPYIQTTGGNGFGQACVFPFWYNGRWIHGCIIAQNGGFPWCAVTRNYDRDKQWGQCIVSTTTRQSSCDNPYTMTQNTNTFGGSLQNGITAVETCKAECNKNGACVGFDFDRNSGTSSRCYLHFGFNSVNTAQGVDQYRIQERQCTGSGAGNTDRSPLEIKGGNANTGDSQCVFPFSKGAYRYGSCLSGAWFAPWCATTSNYDNDKKWGECSNIPTDAVP